MARSLIVNLTGQPVPLPFPYKGYLQGGEAACVEGAKATVESRLGGADLIRYVLEVRDTLDSATVTSHDAAPGVNSKKITDIADATADADVPSKLQMDTAIAVAVGALDLKDVAKVATTDTIQNLTGFAPVLAVQTITGGNNSAFPTVDGVAPVLGMRVLVKDEAGGNRKANGWYTLTTLGTGATPFVLTRAADANSASELTLDASGTVAEGTTLAGTFWRINLAPTTLGTDPITFTEVHHLPSVSSDKTGISVDADSAKTGISVDADSAKTGISVDADSAKTGISVDADSAKTGISVDADSAKTGISVDADSAKTGISVDADSAKTGISVDNASVGTSVLETFLAPAGAGVAVHAAVLATAANAFPGPITSPAIPRSVQCVFAGGWDGGDITLTGTDQDDAAVVEVIADNPGATVQGICIFKTITAIEKGAIGVAAAAVDVQTGPKIGLMTTITRPIGVVAIDGDTTGEGGAFDVTLHQRGVTFSQAPNGALNFDVMLHLTANHNHAVTDGGHTHTGTVTDGGHVHTGTVTDGGHTHTGTVTDGGHTHTGTVTDGGHVHTGTVTDGGHTHTGTVTDGGHTHTGTVTDTGHTHTLS